MTHLPSPFPDPAFSMLPAHRATCCTAYLAAATRPGPLQLLTYVAHLAVVVVDHLGVRSPSAGAHQR
jgi:hypothetical protein